ncbi:hypothetical protein AB0E75_30930 [Streptomyces griseoviridis]|uniref:Uncharacterized protein n=1 Tax=Streptomyces griseoviridis TaxID=45398 RepID=A0A918GS02_STRGD|nr:hypothetical protein [Streptomyces niveoruber]GGS53424.1 hypothetical protein GCM10010238_48580 [Streptomyces niveoruber]
MWWNRKHGSGAAGMWLRANVRRPRRSPSAAVVLCAVGSVWLGCLLVTLLAFALARPGFEGLWDEAQAARAAEDSYSPDPLRVVPPVLLVIPLGALVVAAGSAVVHAVAAAGVSGGGDHRRLSVREAWRRLRPAAAGVLVLYALRAALLLAATLAAGVAAVGVASVLELFTDLAPFRMSGPFETPAGLASMLAPAPVALRIAFLLAPAAVAVDGVTARTALRRSWSLVRRRRVWPWFLAASLLGASVAGAVWLSAWRAVTPLRPVLREAVLTHVTSNGYVAEAAATVLPAMTLTLLCVTVCLHPAQTLLTAVYVRLR